MRVLWSIVVKDLVLLARDRTGLFFTLLFPLIMAVFFGAVFSGPSSGSSVFNVDVVDEDNSEESQNFAAQLSASDELETEMTDRASALARVEAGKRIAYLVIPFGFGAARGRIFWGAPATIEIGVDPSRKAEAAMLQGVVLRHLSAGFESLLADESASRSAIANATAGLPNPGVSPKADELRGFLSALEGFLDAMPTDSASEAWSPGSVTVKAVVREGRQPPSYFAISFPQGIVWGLMMCAMTFALGLVTERAQGTLMRLRVSPLPRAAMLAGKAGACFCVVVVVQVLLLMVGKVIFGVELGSPALLAVSIGALAICFVGIMLLLSVLGKTEKAASGYATAIMLVLMMIGGGMIPVFIMPGWMQSLSHFSPVKWAIVALEGSTWRGFGLAELATPWAVLVAVGVGCFALGAQLFRRR